MKFIVVVENVDYWFNKLSEMGIKIDPEEVYSSPRLNLREFSFSDPEGYSIEFGQFLTPLGV